jgi:hypothetical protein
MSAPNPSIVVEGPASVPVDDTLANVTTALSLPPGPKPGSGIRVGLTFTDPSDLLTAEGASRATRAAVEVANNDGELEVHFERAQAVDSAVLVPLTKIGRDAGLRWMRIRVKERG